jgi:hypothetical protein
VSPGRRADLPRPPATIGTKGNKPEIYKTFFTANESAHLFVNLTDFFITFMLNSYFLKNSYFGMPGDGR